MSGTGRGDGGTTAWDADGSRGAGAGERLRLAGRGPPQGVGPDGREVAAVAASRTTKGKGKTNGMLARRKAALERAASRMAEQRREAQEAEAERLRQEAAFDELAADFELAVEEELVVAAEVEEEVRRVRERGRVRIDAARVMAARVVLAMGEAGETVAGCGRRLGVGVDRVKELRRLGREALAGQDAGAGPEKMQVGVPEKRTVPRTTGAGPGGGQQREGGAAPVAAPPVAVATVPPRGVPPTGPSAGPSGFGGAGG
ncbi:hypothetical protein ACFWGI_36660 [Streptomyces niveus]|uniref:hypothetical protein n=1 Tax=Streptomyces niveus TaxID=193462 RepID=UPI00364CC5E8